MLSLPWAGSAMPLAGQAPVTTASTPLAAPTTPCAGRFVAHDLDHTTRVPDDTVEHFEANGAGVGIGDLDNDGDQDIVLGNHAGGNSILWNEGGLRFTVEHMSQGDTRGVALVDVDADGWLDILFTRRTGAITFWRNQGGDGQPGRFAWRVLPGIARPAYAMAWGDLDGDGDLDLVTGSYDASLLEDLGNEFLLRGDGGVTVYENRGGRFVGQPLQSSAQAMAIALFDIDRDGQRDIVVGNDFNLPDYAWRRTASGWQPTAFDATSHSTMGLDACDIDNDGIPELFASDMAPYAEDPATVAAWEPLMADMAEDVLPDDDPQIGANTLQVWTETAGYQEAAGPRGLDATGWTWSGKFGDLDQDGWLDFYAVNGMSEATLLSHLPDGELVEENQALRNSGGGYFQPAPEWGLGSSRSGRGMSMADLDGDGDLDIVVNNLQSAAQLFENRLCGGGSLLVDLRWPGSANPLAIGAEATLRSSAGSFTRDLRVASGYLSSDAPRLHFGFPVTATLQVLDITWPDGAVSTVARPHPSTLVTVTRQDKPEAEPASSAALDAELAAFIQEHSLTGDPSAGRDLPSIDDPVAQLGMKLFFSKALGGDMDAACVTCHHPLLGGGDGLPLSIGVGAVEPDLLGPGRAHPSGEFNVPRNAPTTFNIGLWEQALFFDGRVESLGQTPGQNGVDGLGIRTPDTAFGVADPLAGDDLVAAQSRFPITSREEMRGKAFEAYRPNAFVRARLCERLGDFGAGEGELTAADWLAEFQQAFASRLDGAALINDANLSAALAAYQRSQVFVDTPWRAYVQGDQDAIDAAAKRGALLFFRPVEQGGADCAACHRGDFFTDEQFYTLAVPQIGPGKDDGPFNDDDYGRFRATGRPEDMYAFRTPTLLNVAATGPYGHDGAYATLEGIVRHHLNPEAAVAAFDPTQLDPAARTTHWAENTQRAVAKLAADRRAGRTPLQDVTLSNAQVADLVSFLHTLTDPCVLDPVCLARWIPGADDSDPDGLRLRAEGVLQRMENSE
jgi:cytochrome c peroxidase